MTTDSLGTIYPVTLFPWGWLYQPEDRPLTSAHNVDSFFRRLIAPQFSFQDVLIHTTYQPSLLVGVCHMKHTRVRLMPTFQVFSRFL